jgi:Fe-S cluster assembly protein SufD
MTDPFVQSQLDAYKAHAAQLPGARNAAVAGARLAHLAAFGEVGLPSTRDERWKYTPLKPLAQRALALGDRSAVALALAPEAWVLAGVDGPRLVFVNGAYRADLSALPESAEGLSLRALGEALDADELSPQTLFPERGALARDAFAHLNAALVGDGAWVRVAPGSAPAAPLHLVYVGAPAERERAIHVRNLIGLGEGARLTVVEHLLGAGDHAHVGNLLCEIALARGAQLRWVRLQDEAPRASLLARTDVVLDEAASYESSALELGAALARHELRLQLAGRGARVRVRGACALVQRQHGELQLSVTHEALDTASDVAWRAVADQRAHGVFGGAILVQPGADGADAQLTNKNLLLSPHAEVDTKPALEIHADEVKASHGATVGQLDEGALFYLRSRGVPHAQARALLTFAFCRSMLDEVPIAPLREALAQRLREHLPGVAEGLKAEG